ncbi:MAG: MotA/TolQ/ExbB proton channel family protein [Pseudomonadota bacterium]
MKLRIITLSLLLTFAGFGTANAQDPKAQSLNELLRLVEQGRAGENRENRTREQEFRNNQANQQRLLNEAEARKRAEEQRSVRLETEYEENEERVAVQTEAFEKRLGSLKELFGVLQQVSGDTRSFLDDSLTSAQYPNRGEFLTALAAKMGGSAELASIEEMERLWFELQREMTESGKVAKFQADVVSADGSTETRDVVRVGAFNLISDGKYLKFEGGRVTELPRQPGQARFVDSTSDLVTASSGMVPFALDPTRGSILAAYIESPTLQERISQGGLVGYIILGLGALGLLIALERLISLTLASGKVSSQLKSNKPDKGNALGRVLMVAENNPGIDREALELKLGEAILKEQPSLNRGVGFIKIISVIAPLLGLLGTVTGMIKTFQAITLFGTGDPQIMAGGISQALVTTVLGLVVAIPMVLLHTVVASRSKRIVHILQEQSAGIIAERDEGGNA